MCCLLARSGHRAKKSIFFLYLALQPIESIEFWQIEVNMLLPNRLLLGETERWMDTVPYCPLRRTNAGTIPLPQAVQYCQCHSL
jgi:hypothetical protein